VSAHNGNPTLCLAIIEVRGLEQELFIRYHDRLRDLGQSPNELNKETDHPAKGSRPFRSEPNRTSSAADSRR
jgi:hypothetical protein